jgi:small Trp-rich protein
MLIVGVLLLAAKMAQIGPFAGWSWWIVLAPFAAAAAWWQFSDASGLSRRREMDKMAKRKEDRRVRALEALGMNTAQHEQAAQSVKDKARQLSSADPTQAPPAAEPPRRDSRS